MAKKRSLLLDPQGYDDAWHKDLARLLIAEIKRVIFDPLIAATDETDRADNAKKTPLEMALRAGTVQFQRGAFRGDLNAAISKEIKALGGRFYKGEWRLPSPLLTPALQKAVAANVSRAAKLAKLVSQALDSAPDAIRAMVKNLTVEDMGLQGLNRVSWRFKKDLNKAVSVYPDLGMEGKAALKAGYEDTDTKPIRKKLLHEFEDRTKAVLEDFAYEEVVDLRKRLQPLILGGRPRQEIRDEIGGRLKISATRCRFIARQETALLTVEFTKNQYLGAGIKKYKWITAKDHVVRTTPNGGHKALDGEIYAWDAGPDARYFSTGESCHPGEDYNCRCQARPIVEW